MNGALVHTAWHIAYNHWSKGMRRASINEDDVSVVKLRFEGCRLVDIWLDVDDGQMKVQMLDHRDMEAQTYPEIKCWDMPCKSNQFGEYGTDFKGYVPHFNVSGKGIVLRMAKIPVEFYGKSMMNDMFEATKN